MRTARGSGWRPRATAVRTR
uniref:Uncharacterized protein n=1 Tax=Arundo donax TaxID=35708 RepID=A0A0A8YQ92_ARUDO